MARVRDEIDRLYHTKRWKSLRLIVGDRDFWLCQECKRRGLVSRGNIVHHITEAREDLSLFWDIDNLEVSCVPCHNADHPDRALGSTKKKEKRKKHVVKLYANNEMR